MSANTIITSIVQGGTNSHSTVAEEANAIATDFVTQGVVGAITLNTGSGGTGSFCVNADATADMGVTIKAGQAYVTATPSSQDSQVLRARASSDYTSYTINANSSGSTKYDWIYLKVDATKANSPASDASDVTSIYTSRSSSNTTDNGTPPTYGLLLAVVTVANGASSITNSNITDKRFNTSIGVQNGSLIVNQNGTGTDAIVQAAGIDANVALSLKSKGTGAIKFTAGSDGVTGLVNSLYNPYKFSVYQNSTQSISSTGTAKITLDTVIFDTGSNFDQTTNHRFTAPIAGFYYFHGSVQISNAGMTSGNIGVAFLYKNGSEVFRGVPSVGTGNTNNLVTSQVSGFMSLSATDYVELYAYNGDGSSSRSTGTGRNLTYLFGYLLSAT